MGNANSNNNKNIRTNRVYVLKLENDKYYIGRTAKPVAERFTEHLTGQGSAWTALHKPVKVLETVENADDFDEDKYTKKYMPIYGIENVRGAAYVSIELPEYQVKSLEKELCSSQNKCFKCQQTGHYANQCNKSVQLENMELVNNLNNNLNNNDKPQNQVNNFIETALLNLCKCMQMHTFTKFNEAFSVKTEKFLHSKNVRKYM